MSVEIILGPPGTGKTTSLLKIVEDELASGTPPDRIGFVSFTTRAADEAATRACKKFNLERSDLPHFRTLHSLCFRWLGMRRGGVLEGESLQEFAREAGVRITGRWTDDGTLTGFEAGDRIRHLDNLARVRGVSLRQVYDQDDGGIPWSEVDRVARALRSYKERTGLLDFTDMMTEFVKRGGTLGLDVLIADEVQDQSHVAWEVFAQLALSARRVIVAGDDDQAIYRWAGADVDHLIDLEGESRVLGQSYRVPRRVQELANAVIGPVRHRRQKEWASRDDEGEITREGEFHAADLSGDDVMVLARNSYVFRETVEPELRRLGVIYEINGRSSVRMSVLSAVTDWERLRAGEHVTADAARAVYEFMSVRAGSADDGSMLLRGHKKLPAFQSDEPVCLEDLERAGGLLTRAIWHEAMDRLPQTEKDYILTARRRGERLTRRPRIRLSTIHGAKGGEADHVVLLLDVARRTHREIAVNPDDERRVWYTGVTRARQKLTLVRASTPLRCPWL